ncbi:hypothetical protein AAMO2058_000368000 [Amorphochlora amoebiformis]
MASEAKVSGEVSRVDKFLDRAKKGEILPPHAIKWVCAAATKVFREEPNLVCHQAPVKIIGDIHGQFHDLRRIFEIGGYPPNTKYIFLGDYVDRGANSVLVVTLLAALKVRYPDCITMLRGNHECRQISQAYGFRSECNSKFQSLYENAGDDVWKFFTDMFDYLPIGALIDSTILAIHAGLSPAISKLDQIRVMERFSEISKSNALQDLMWSDPSTNIKGFALSDRGNGYLFGEDVFYKFIAENKLEFVVRSHQLCNDGFEILFDRKLLTVWSAPNYCYRFGNKASILTITSDHETKFEMFEASRQDSKHADFFKEREDESKQNSSGPSSES